MRNNIPIVRDAGRIIILRSDPLLVRLAAFMIALLVAFLVILIGYGMMRQSPGAGIVVIMLIAVGIGFLFCIPTTIAVETDRRTYDFSRGILPVIKNTGSLDDVRGLYLMYDPQRPEESRGPYYVLLYWKRKRLQCHVATFRTEQTAQDGVRQLAAKMKVPVLSAAEID